VALGVGPVLEAFFEAEVVAEAGTEALVETAVLGVWLARGAVD